MFRKIRIAFLLVILFAVGARTWLTFQRTTDWNRGQWAVIYPIKGDDSIATESYVGGLSEQHFHALEEFFAGQGKQYGLPKEEPLDVFLAPQVHALPPPPPPGREPMQVALWSLKMRWWAWRNNTDDMGGMKIFVVYHDPAQNKILDHSLGLRNGSIGVVHAFAADRMSDQNNVIIAHELMHLFGASDKYDPATNQPIHPDGYAEPDLSPIHPQKLAEIMGGRVPRSPTEAHIPAHLRKVVVGETTAREVRWIGN